MATINDIQTQILTPIANAIRTKEGSTDKIPNNQLASRIENLQVGSGGGEDMLQARVDATNSCKYLFTRYNGTTLDYIKNLDTSKVTDMSYMFDNSPYFTTIPLLDTSKVTNMSYMFQSCLKLTTIPQFNLASVTNTNSMFRTCNALLSIPLLDTSQVTDMSYMFYNCKKLTTISQFNLESVATTTNMFYGCSVIHSISLLNTSKVTNMSYMFGYCNKAETIEIVDMNSVTDNSYSSNMFTYCQALTNLTILNVRVNLQIGNGTNWGHLLTLDSLINTCKELINVGSARTLTIGTANLEKIANTYVKFTDSLQTTITKGTKGDVVVCESTDEGAMLLSDYASLKNWTLA